MTKDTRAPTITEVALAAGVDRSSVSRAFSRPDLLRAETVAAIRAVADRLGYAPNRNARALSTGRHGNIALIVPDIADLAFPPLIRAAQLAAYRAGLCMFIGSSDLDAQLERRLVGQFMGQVDGLMLVSPRLSGDAIKAIAAQKPTVLVSRDIPELPGVTIEGAVAIDAAVAHLAGLGHRRAAYVGGPPDSWLNKTRRSALVNAATRQGLRLDTINAVGADLYDLGWTAAREVARSAVTAVLAFNDIVAQGVIAGLAATGLTVPEAISVVSCEEMPGAAGRTQLTTIGSRMADAGKIAVGLLVDGLETGGPSGVRYKLDAPLLVRGSSGPATSRARPR